MSVTALHDSLSMSQRLMYRQMPDAGFFDKFATAFAQYESSSSTLAPTAEMASNERLLADLLGDVHVELSRRRSISQEDQAAFADILNRAYTEGGMIDPAAFLQSLTPEELAVVQRNHCLTDRIDPSGLSREGAYNLLLPEGWRVDFNHDDLIEVGAGLRVQFPPSDAPTEFLDAWFAATQNMGEMDAATYGLRMFISMHTVPVGDTPMKRTLPPDSIDTYRQVLANHLDMVERLRGQISEGQYERDKAFFSLLKSLLD